MEKERDYRLDWLRVIAISMIVLMHSPKPDVIVNGSVLSAISYLTAPGLVLFFMISGSLLLGSTLNTRDFFKRRFSKILWPTLFWTLFYLVTFVFINSVSIKDVLKTVLSIPFSAQGHGVLWFMYTLAGLYLLVPILSRWLNSSSKREVEFYLFLWGITLLYPYLSIVLDINESNTGILYYFTGYVGYFVLGYYLNQYYKSSKVSHVIAAWLLAIVIPVIIYTSGIECDFYSMLWYLSLPVALMAFGWFVLIKRFPNKASSFIGHASALSFGVYLVHIFIMRRIVWHIGFIGDLPGLIQIPCIMLITLLASYLVVWLISRLPFSKYIIGV